MKPLLTVMVLLLAGCAARQPGAPTYRLHGSLLIPPGVAAADLQSRTFVADVLPGPGSRSRGICFADDGAVALTTRRNKLMITVRRYALAAKSPGWLSEWAARKEAQGCIAPGSWWDLANRIAESVPLDDSTAFRLRYADNVDIGPQVRIQIDSPILRDDRAAVSIDGPMKATEELGGLRVEMKSTDNLLGYERAWYRMERKPGGGLRITPLSAERHTGGTTEERALPAKNYLNFPAEAGYYRLVYKQQQTEFTALVVAGRTRGELDETAKQLAAGGATCQTVRAGFCLGIPKGVAANLFLPVMVNGKEVLIYWGAGVGSAIRLSGKDWAGLETVLPTLAVSKLYNGKPVPVEFNRSENTILNLPLSGGETISWH